MELDFDAVLTKLASRDVHLEVCETNQAIRRREPIANAERILFGHGVSPKKNCAHIYSCSLAPGHEKSNREWRLRAQELTSEYVAGGETFHKSGIRQPLNVCSIASRFRPSRCV